MLVASGGLEGPLSPMSKVPGETGAMGPPGLTGAAVSLAYAELPAGRWLTILAAVLLLFVAVAIGSDNGFLFFLAWEAITVCVYLIASAGHDRSRGHVHHQRLRRHR